MRRIPAKTSLLIIALLHCCLSSGAQGFLAKSVTIHAEKKPLSQVLHLIEKQGGFYFSYNGKVISGNRTVSINVVKKTVQQVLDELFDGACTYKETRSHIVLLAVKGGWYTLSGYVLDATSGERVSHASVYERQQLVATLTNEEGYFRLRLRDRFPTASITVSKEWYTDTSLVFTAGTDQQYNLPVHPIMRIMMNDVVVNQHNRAIDHTWLGRLFLSAKLKAQTRNITSFIANRPIQSSFIPGIGTHGRIGAQVVNKFSLNVLGGYTAGVNGVEVGGFFNMDRGDVRYVQVAGAFNNVGGSVSGTQIAGIANSVMDSVSGVQIGGAGNYINESMEGVQVAGIGNFVRKKVTGTQVAGASNIALKEMNGVQVSGIFNYTHYLNGVQIGLINVADSSDGYSIGLINIVKNGYHKVSVSSNEVLHLNVAVKTGNAKLYTLLLAGAGFENDHKIYSFGAGLGREFILYKKLTLTTELTMQHLYMGEFDYSHLLYRVQPSFTYRITPLVAVFAGSSISIYHSQKEVPVKGYEQDVAGGRTAAFKISNSMNGWLGWQFGITVF